MIRHLMNIQGDLFQHLPSRGPVKVNSIEADEILSLLSKVWLLPSIAEFMELNGGLCLLSMYMRLEMIHISYIVLRKYLQIMSSFH